VKPNGGIDQVFSKMASHELVPLISVLLKWDDPGAASVQVDFHRNTTDRRHHLRVTSLHRFHAFIQIFLGEVNIDKSLSPRSAASRQTCRA
jgi:hypothetical protein